MAEIEGMKKLGVIFIPNAVAGRSVTVDELLKEEGSVAILSYSMSALSGRTVLSLRLCLIIEVT